MRNRYRVQCSAAIRGIIVCLTYALCIGAISLPPPPQAKQTNSSRQPTTTDQRGSQTSPFIVRVLPAANANEEAAELRAQRQEEAQTNERLVELMAFVAIIAVLQLAAFSYQAWQLRQSVKKIDEVAVGQTAGMAKTIGESRGAVTAMEGLAGGIAALSSSQRDFWEKQMRAYVTVAAGMTYPQSAENNIKAVVQLQVTNEGITPARKVRVATTCRILPIPIPDDFDFALPEPAGMEATLNPRHPYIYYAIAPQVYDEELMQRARALNGCALYAWASVWYDDVLGARKHQHFCQWAVWEDKRFLWINATRHNDGD